MLRNLLPDRRACGPALAARSAPMVRLVCLTGRVVREELLGVERTQGVDEVLYPRARFEHARVPQHMYLKHPRSVGARRVYPLPGRLLRVRGLERPDVDKIAILMSEHPELLL